LILLGFILKLFRNENYELIRLNNRERKQMASVCPVRLPFTLEVKERSSCDSLSFTIKESGKYAIVLYAYVGIEEIRKQYVSTHIKYKEGDKKNLQDALDLLSGYSCTVRNVNVSVEEPEKFTFDLKEIPTDIRDKIKNVSVNQLFASYLAYVYLDDRDKLVDNNAISGIATVIKSTVNGDNMQNEVVEQYIQTADQRVFPLKNVFDAGLDNTQDAPVPSAPTMMQSDDKLCIICHNYPVTRVILPCRHKCLCKLCFQKVNECPICRLNIEAYFPIKSEKDFPLSQQEERNQVREEMNNMGVWNFIKSIWNAS